MSDDLDPGVIKKTQDLLGSVIKKPALSEKSLKRPPFRFLHDVISNVIKSTGFMKGLYSPEELQSENVKDKENKILFLQKAIDVLGLVTNQPINLKPSKVVAGHDAEKTNAFLQALAKAAKSKLDSTGAVEKVLNELNQGSPSKPVKERRPSVDKKAKEKAHSRSLTKTLDPVKKSSKESSKSKDGEKPKEKSRESKKERDKSKDRSKHKSEDSKKSREKSSRSKESPKIEDKVVPEQSEAVNGLFDGLEQLSPLKLVDNEEPTAFVNGESHDKHLFENLEQLSPLKFVDNEELTAFAKEELHEKEQSEIEASENVSEKPVREKSHRPHSSRSARPPSARSKRTKPSEEGDSDAMPGLREPMVATSASIMGSVPVPQDPTSESNLMPLARPPSARPGSARPSSSRPAPPRIRIRHVVDNEENSFRPATAKPVENVIIDQGNQSEEEEESFIVVEDEPPEIIDEEVSKAVPAKTPDEDKGSLVKKLLETKKDLEGGSQHTPTKKVEIDKSQMTEAARTRERDSASKELNQLRGFVQSLSKTAVPLGRMLDFLQEDMDAMKMELKMWMEEHAQNVAALHKEETATESLLEPLRAQLDDLDQVVQNQLDANSALKASIARNDERIQRMLSSVSHKS